MFFRMIVLFLSISSQVLVSAERYAIIYTPLPENEINTKSNDKYDPRLMEIAWKTTFLKWEELFRKEKYKMENIFVLYADGIDYSSIIYGINLDLRYSPHQYGIDYICAKKTPANKNNLETLTEILKDKLKSEDELNIFKYDPDTNKLIESK